VTKESFGFLLSLAHSHRFVLIGGWAAYLHTRTQKSRDVDIVVDFNGLLRLQAEFPVQKNERLRKYEIKKGDFDVDVYAPNFSRLSYPLPELLLHHDEKDGIAVATVPQLLLLKIGAYIDRKGSIKGMKDEVDIISLLYYSKPDKNEFLREAGKTKMASPEELVAKMVAGFSQAQLPYIGAEYVAFKKWRKKFLSDWSLK